MIAISKALKIIERASSPRGSEKILLGASIGRILRESIIADSDLPPFDRSQMDGYAVVAADTKSAPVSVLVVGEAAAGAGWHRTMKRGESVQIMTGAPVPDGADAVQKVELTSQINKPDEMVVVLEPAEKGKYIVRKGSEIRKGKTVFRLGDVVTEHMVATLAAFGYAKVNVANRPSVAIIGTGSEIVEIAKKPGRDQIRNSNSVMLEVLCHKFGARPTVIANIKDKISDLKTKIEETAANFDVLILTGGVSVGKYDLTKKALAELGAEIFFDKVRLKPGKPAVFARLGKTLIFGLPGNPVSAAVTFHLFVRKAILRLQGASATDLRKGFAVLEADAKAVRERDSYLPSRLETNRLGQMVASQLKWQGSSDFIGFARADSLIFVPRDRSYSEGEVVDIVYL